MEIFYSHPLQMEHRFLFFSARFERVRRCLRRRPPWAVYSGACPKAPVLSVSKEKGATSTKLVFESGTLLKIISFSPNAVIYITRI